jgi:hypothetical protein
MCQHRCDHLGTLGSQGVSTRAVPNHDVICIFGQRLTRRYFTAQCFVPALNLADLASVHIAGPLNFLAQALRPDLQKITQLGINRRYEAGL